MYEVDVGRYLMCRRHLEAIHVGSADDVQDARSRKMVMLCCRYIVEEM